MALHALESKINVAHINPHVSIFSQVLTTANLRTTHFACFFVFVTIVANLPIFEINQLNSIREVKCLLMYCLFVMCSWGAKTDYCNGH